MESARPAAEVIWLWDDQVLMVAWYFEFASLGKANIIIDARFANGTD